MEPGPEREQLGFREAVLPSFAFLNSHGFKPVQEQVTFVRFESGAVFVNVYHGRASFELGVEMGQLDNPGGKISLNDVIAWCGAGEAEDFGQHVVFQVSDREAVQEFVPKLARLLQKYADPFLKGDAAAYESVAEARSRTAAEYRKKMELDRIRTKAEAAWHQKDYQRVVELYGSKRDDLSNVETSRLAYAEKHLGGTAANAKEIGAKRKDRA
jgi:hypothetical protein